MYDFSKFDNLKNIDKRVKTYESIKPQRMGTLKGKEMLTRASRKLHRTGSLKISSNKFSTEKNKYTARREGL